MAAKNTDQDETRGLTSARNIERLLSGLAVVVACVGIARIAALAYASNWDAAFNATTLMFFGVAGALLLSRELKSLAFGDFKVEFEKLRREVDAAQATADNAAVTAENAQANVLTGGTTAGRMTATTEQEPIPGTAPDDPWKGVFGGRSESHGRRLEADVAPLSANSSLFTVRLRLVSTDKKRPLAGVVQFFLHDTFRNDRPVVTVGPNGAAELVLRAYGAFTVGAKADDGATQLELDLAELEEAPERFRKS